jgi:Helicase associated domain
LGQKVASIRETGLYIGTNEKRRAQLDKLGFIWRVRAPANTAQDTVNSVPFSQIYDALVAYREQIKPTGQLTIPLDFTVPDSEAWPENTRGLPLGRTLETLKSKSFLDQNPDACKKLQEIGVIESTDSPKVMPANDRRFQAIYDALERYKEIYGDLMVPQPFVVPDKSKDFPEHTWGIRLGARVNAIRTQGSYVKNNTEREEMLDELGFVWNLPQKESKKRVGRRSLEEIDREERKALEAQSAAKSYKGLEPRTYGESEDGEEEVESFLSSFDFSGSGQDKDALSSVKAPTWGLEARDGEEGSVAAESAETSEMEVEEEWEDELTLGESLSAAKNRAIDAGIVEEIDSKRPTKRKREPPIPWFNDDFGDDFVFEDVVEALTLYKQFYGDFSNLTNDEYVIPSRSGSDPEFDEYDDLKDDFGDAVDDLSMYESGGGAEFTRFDQFQDPNSMTDDQIEAEISKMEQSMFDTESDRATVVSTVVPVVEVNWPEHLEGMRLGNIVRRIRDGSLEVKHLPERKEQLDAIEFDWGDTRKFLDVPFEKAMCAMYAYYLIRGDMFVPFDFVMPEGEPWPSALVGYELGSVVKRIRELQNFFEAFHTEKVYVLRMIDFVWFPTLALPVDPNEGEMTADRTLLIALGHPDFREARVDPREPVVDQNRPEFLGGDPRQWWRVWHSWDYAALNEQGRTYDDAHRLRKKGDVTLAEEHDVMYGPGLYARIISLTQELLERAIIEDEEEKDELADLIADYMYEMNLCVDFDDEDMTTLTEYLTAAKRRHDIEDRKIQNMEQIEEDRIESERETGAKRILKEEDHVPSFEEEEVIEEEEDFESDDSEDDEEYEYEWEYDSDFEEELGLEANEEE